MFSREQKKILAACFIAYLAAYICRLNLAEALPEIGKAFSCTDAQLGSLQTAFAVVYATGQLVVGALVDRFLPRRFILCGLAGSMLANLLFSFCGGYPAMLAIWILNGVAQSMLWTPTVKTLSDWFEGNARVRAAFIMSASAIVGYLVSWTIAGCTVSFLGWRFTFAVPAVIMLFVLMMAFKELPRKQPLKQIKESGNAAGAPMKGVIFHTGLWAVLLVCIVNGFVRDGITTWGPTMIANGSGSVLITLLIPVLNIAGWAVSRWYCTNRRGNVRRGMAIFLLAGMFACIGISLAWSRSAILFAVLLGIGCAILHGNTPLLVSMLPIEYERFNRVAIVAGLVDAFIYLGSALSGVVTGMISDRYGWSMVFPQWALACGLGIAFALLSRIRRRNSI